MLSENTQPAIHKLIDTLINTGSLTKYVKQRVTINTNQSAIDFDILMNVEKDVRMDVNEKTTFMVIS